MALSCLASTGSLTSVTRPSTAGSYVRPLQRASLTGFTPHSLRHAYASAMLARGVQITELAHFLGHKDINTTHAVYGHLLPSAAKRAVRR